MKIHILGICGTFMGGLAQILAEKGHQVSGSDHQFYPPMSGQLEALGVEMIQGYDSVNLPDADLFVIGNALSRGNSSVEHILNAKLPFTSGPQMLGEMIKDKTVIAVAGTHGKTSTSSMLAWILEYAEMKPGFLIGGIPNNFNVSARIGGSKFFVVEADEYDTAFFDKRSKFVHYSPKTTILNNLEFDHADIFKDIADIQVQFHNLIRTVPNTGLLITPSDDLNLSEVIDQGCWSNLEYIGKGEDWDLEFIDKGSSTFSILYKGELKGSVSWTQIGNHNARNGLAAIAAANHIGIEPELACKSIMQFSRGKASYGEDIRGRWNYYI